MELRKNALFVVRFIQIRLQCFLKFYFFMWSGSTPVSHFYICTVILTVGNDQFVGFGVF